MLHTLSGHKSANTTETKTQLKDKIFTFVVATLVLLLAVRNDGRSSQQSVMANGWQINGQWVR